MLQIRALLPGPVDHVSMGNWFANQKPPALKAGG
jgi:hypothetical protein